MKAYYEQFRESDNFISVSINGDHTYSPHFHMNIEILLIKSGDYVVSIGNNEYTVSDGDIVFFDSYESHSYKKIKTDKITDDAVVIIPPLFAKEFIEKKRGKNLTNPIIHDEKFCDNLLDFACKVLAYKLSLNVATTAVNFFLSLIEERLTFNGEQKNDKSLIKNILEYVEYNYTHKITLNGIAKELGYTKEHISRTFKKYISQGFNAYVNDLRLSKVAKNIEMGNPVIQSVYDAGFNSLETYYRNKKQKERK